MPFSKPFTPANSFTAALVPDVTTVFYLSRDLLSPSFSSSFSVLQLVKCMLCQSELLNHHILGEIVKVLLPEVHTVIDTNACSSPTQLVFDLRCPTRQMSSLHLYIDNINQPLHLSVSSYESFYSVC